MSKLPKNSFTIKEIDKGVEKEHKFHWIKIEDLDKENFKPNHISKIIRNNIESNNNIVLSDNR